MSNKRTYQQALNWWNGLTSGHKYNLKIEYGTYNIMKMYDKENPIQEVIPIEMTPNEAYSSGYEQAMEDGARKDDLESKTDDEIAAIIEKRKKDIADCLEVLRLRQRDKSEALKEMDEKEFISIDGKEYEMIATGATYSAIISNAKDGNIAQRNGWPDSIYILRYAVRWIRQSTKMSESQLFFPTEVDINTKDWRLYKRSTKR
jgi:hypothetical protein